MYSGSVILDFMLPAMQFNNMHLFNFIVQHCFQSIWANLLLLRSSYVTEKSFFLKISNASQERFYFWSKSQFFNGLNFRSAVILYRNLYVLLTLKKHSVLFLTKLDEPGKHFIKPLLNFALYLRSTWSTLCCIAMFCNSEELLSKTLLYYVDCHLFLFPGFQPLSFQLLLQ